MNSSREICRNFYDCSHIFYGNCCLCGLRVFGVVLIFVPQTTWIWCLGTVFAYVVLDLLSRSFLILGWRFLIFVPFRLCCFVVWATYFPAFCTCPTPTMSDEHTSLFSSLILILLFWLFVCVCDFVGWRIWLLPHCFDCVSSAAGEIVFSFAVVLFLGIILVLVTTPPIRRRHHHTIMYTHK